MTDHDDRDRDLDDEIRSHLTMAEADRIRRGDDRAEARHAARREFGNVGQVKDAVRDRWTGHWLASLRHDLRDAYRAISASPRFTALVATTLALGIGAAIAVFTIVDGVLLRPLPYQKAGQLIAVREIQGRGTGATSASFPEFEQWRKLKPASIVDIAAWFPQPMTLTGAGDPVTIHGERISTNLPALLGVVPLRGRLFLPEEESRTAQRVIVIGERTWRERFAADSAIVGKAIRMDGNPYTVVGVIPTLERSQLPDALTSGQRSEFWVPLRLNDTIAPLGLHFMHAVGRLRNGATIEQARAQLAQVGEGMRRADSANHAVDALPLAQYVVGDSDRLLKILLGAVLMLLLIACANVANLLLAHGIARDREFAVRVALGAGRRRVVTQLLFESFGRALIGGVAGVGLAATALWAARRWLGVQLPRFAQVEIDLRVVGAAALLCVGTGVVFGLLPALRAMRSDPNSALRGGGRGVYGRIGSSRLRRALVISEIAMSFVLLIGAGLLIRSFERLAAADRGFDKENITATALGLPGSRYRDSTTRRAFFRRALEEVGAIPGVQAVALVNNIPTRRGTTGGIPIEGRTFAQNASDFPQGAKRVVSNGYLQLLGARLVEGRFFDQRDAENTEAVVIVNETFARKWFPGESAIGKRVAFAWEIDSVQTIVGVVADISEGPVTDGKTGAIYVSIEHRSESWMHLMVRSRLSSADLFAAIRERVRAIDPLLPVPPLQTMESVVASGMSRQRVAAVLVATFAVLALTLAAVGLYGVMSYSVTQRTQELGIRAALGARPTSLVRLVLANGAASIAAGVVIGVGGALALSRFIRAELFDVQPTDLATYAMVAVMLALVGLVAMVVPALRATRSDPLSALRAE